MKLRPFELALVIIFGGLALGALIMLKFYQPAPKQDDGIVVQVGEVTIWGTLPSGSIKTLLTELSEGSDSYLGVTYQYFEPDEFDGKLLSALADGTGPDLVLLSHEKLAEMRKRIQPVSYESFPLRDFKNSYIDGAEIFALSDGLYGYPIVVDPLMMYWNRDLLSTEGYLAAPKSWESLVNVYFSELIERDFNRTISRSVVAMGEYGNVRNAFGIISALLMQQGTLGVLESGEGEYRISLNTSNSDTEPLTTTADFYTRFSKPSNSLYSWNRAFEEDLKQFISQNLVFYFGYGSEAKQIERLNPNLNFDIAEIPQGETATLRRTYGRFYALSALKSSDNKVGASAVMLTLANAANTQKIATATGMAPVYRSLVSQGSNDTYGRVIYQSAAISYGWLNPDLHATNQYFETMMRDINENRRDVSGATSDLLTRLRNEY